MESKSPAPTQPMQFGVPFDNLWQLALFVLCLAAAIGLVYLFCRKKFGEPSTAGTGDYLDQFLPRHLATREEYSKGFLVYFGTMAAVVLLLSLIGPNNLSSLGLPLVEKVSHSVVPIAVAIVLVGVVPTVPLLLEIEKWLRRYADERAYIPASARATAERLAAADFDFTAYGGETLNQREMAGVEAADFTRSRRSLEHDWARLCCLVYEQRWRRVAGLMDWLDADMLRFYADDLDMIENARKSMQVEVTAYRKQRTKDPSYTNEALRGSIRENLYKLYILLGCAVRLKREPYGDIDLALSKFGFKLDHTTAPPSTTDLKLVGIFIAAVAVLALGFAATELGFLGLWTVSPVFPAKQYQPFLDAASILIPHCTAILVADLIRRRGLKKGTWFRAGRRRDHIISANYVRGALACGIAGYVALVLWGFVLAPPTTIGFVIAAPYTLLAMATGGFYLYHLDNVEMNSRPSRRWEIGLQTGVTGLCGLIANAVSFDIIPGGPGIAPDLVILNALYGATVGFVLAWYIPNAAAAKFDPLAEVKEERLRTLEAKAQARFDDPVAAAAWLDRPNATLGNKSPRDAAADVEGFENALSLLQGPQAVAA